MKQMKKLLILIIALLPFAAPAKVCKQDWLAKWRNNQAMCGHYVQIFSSGTGYGMWSAISYNDSGDVVGLSNCSNQYGIGAPGDNCWCKTGVHNNKWVHMGSIYNCNDYCAMECAICVCENRNDIGSGCSTARPQMLAP